MEATTEWRSRRNSEPPEDATGAGIRTPLSAFIGREGHTRTLPRLGSTPAARLPVVLALSAHSLDPFPCEPRHHHEGDHRVGPPPPQDGVEEQAYK
jgi:hypothetical protein